MAIASSQFTITDFSDGISLSGYIGSNLSKSQVYNPDNGSHTPDWASTNLVLTPELYVTSTSSNIITDSQVQSVSWYKDNETSPITSGTTYVLSGAKNHILTIKGNVLDSVTGMKLVCVVSFKDSSTGLTLTHKMDISFVQVKSGGGIADALSETPNGNIFKNGSIQSLIAKCELWKGSVVDNTATYQWYAQDGSISSDQGAGIGWRKLANTANMYTGVTTSSMTVYADAVPSLQAFKCVVKDTDNNNQEYADTVVFVDLSDNIQIVVESTGGDTFVNSQGSSILSARVYQGGSEIDTDGTKYTYKWYKYDKDSKLVSNFGGTGVNYKTGKTLNVGSSDVSSKATFVVEIS